MDEKDIKVVEKEIADEDVLREESIEWDGGGDLLRSIFAFVSETVMSDKAQGKILNFTFGSSVSTAIGDELKSALGPLGMLVENDSPRVFPYTMSLMFDTSVDATSIIHFCIVMLHVITTYKSKWFWMRASIIDTVENFYKHLESSDD